MKHDILLMATILHQLRLVVYPIIYQVFYILGGAGFLNHQQYHFVTWIPLQRRKGDSRLECLFGSPKLVQQLRVMPAAVGSIPERNAMF